MATRNISMHELLGHGAGAGLDVFDVERPLPVNHPIFKAPNTVLLPHIGFETVEAMSAKANIALGYLEDFLEKKRLTTSN
jgi:phosphoglycerate dehydrogenase-like enzyme